MNAASAPAPVARAANLKGLPAVGATLVVALSSHAVREPGDHKGRPYIIYLSPFCSSPFQIG
jgi:hypothetical protein